MNDNLKQLLKEASKDKTVPPGFQIPESEPVEKITEDAPIQQTFSEVVEPVSEAYALVNVTSLTSWLPLNISHFENLKMVTISVRDVQPDNDLVLAVSDRETPDKKRLKIIENANTQPVLDLPGMAMSVFNSGFYILFSHPPIAKFENVYIKGYSLRNKLIVVSCLAHNGLLLPYQIQRVKRKMLTISIGCPPTNNIIKNLDNTLDRKVFTLRYKQSEKIEGLIKIMDGVEWLLARAAEMMDINHLIQIDGVLMNTLK